MSDTLVSARISKAKKAAVVEALSSMGASISDLINDSFDYVLEKGCLPTQSASADENLTTKDFAFFLRRSTLRIDWGTGLESGDYKDLIAAGKASDYESLA